MTELQTINETETLSRELSLVDTETLKRELTRGLEITARHLTYLAKIWRELERRGEDLSDIRRGLLAYLPQIAEERVAPEIVINYAGQKTLLTALSTLPIETQRTIAETGYVNTINDTGDEIAAPLNTLRAAEIDRIFDIRAGMIRSVDEQRDRVRPQQQTRRRPVTSIIGFDQQDGQELVVISGKRVRIDLLLHAIARKYPEQAESLEDVANRFKNN
ncbi:hypothetical protein YD04_002146 [Salmonella enterica subsp. enterica]|nr:hypothetical protein [Salmonella enterica subsp. enterica]EDU8875908.1 hypothetical protein [Salmonella enterica subsp. enterica]